jgi:hypothetical protein
MIFYAAGRIGLLVQTNSHLFSPCLPEAFMSTWPTYVPHIARDATRQSPTWWDHDIQEYLARCHPFHTWGLLEWLFPQ